MRKLQIVFLIFSVSIIILFWYCKKDNEIKKNSDFVGDYCYYDQSINAYMITHCLSVSMISSDSVIFNFSSWLPNLKAHIDGDKATFVPLKRLQQAGSTYKCYYYSGYCIMGSQLEIVIKIEEDSSYDYCVRLIGWNNIKDQLVGIYQNDSSSLTITKYDSLYNFDLNSPNYHYDSIVANITCCGNIYSYGPVPVHELISDTLEQVDIKCHLRYSDLVIIVHRMINQVLERDTLYFSR
ncbi:MAG: hypothetical protein K9J13_15165 [Saprospiraceae bacterium]|nr:hypothetical protein [Saprospiraceae bacterium]